MDTIVQGHPGRCKVGWPDAHPCQARRREYRVQDPTDSLGCLEPGCAGSVAAPEPGAAIGLSIRPNPVADWLTVASPEAVLLGLRLTDLSGRVLEDVQFFRQHGLQEYRLSLAALPPGLYVLSVRTEKGWVGEQVVKN